MHIRVLVSGAMGGTKNLLDVLAKAKVISDLKNSGEVLSFTLRPPVGVSPMHLDGLWAGNVSELISHTPNISCEVYDD